MKTLALLCAVFFLVPPSQSQSYEKQRGPVPDFATALKIAEEFLPRSTV